MPNIKCTDKQLRLIELALDTLSRMTCGQLNEAIRGMECMRGKCFPMDAMHSQEACLDRLRLILFPELPKNASYGVGNKEIGDAQIAYEMVKKLQNYRVRNDFDDRSVLHHAPLHYSKEPLINITED